MEVRIKMVGDDGFTTHENVSSTSLTERETFYIIEFKDGKKLALPTNLILFFLEIPEAGDEEY